MNVKQNYLNATQKYFGTTINSIFNIASAAKALEDIGEEEEEEEKEKEGDNLNNNLPKGNNNLPRTAAMTGSTTTKKEIQGLGKICVHVKPMPLLAAGYSLANWPAPTLKEDLDLTRHIKKLTTDEKLVFVVGLLARKVNIKLTATQYGV